ncbi:MAG: type II toxin-antitoxin system VapC family toxin [Tepidisphaeraceae bacterium]
MSFAVIDTDVFSFIFKKDSRASLYTPHLRGQRRALCFMTVAEAYRWSIRRSWSSGRTQELLDQISQYTVLPEDDEMAWHWARVTSIKGRPIEPSDAWIAAAALRHGLPLVTHNRRHFEHISGLTVISEA